MLEAIKRDRVLQITLLLFILLTLWWVLTKTIWHNQDYHNQLFAAFYGVMALWGSFWGMLISKKWGWGKSLFGRAILMFSLGLFAQEFGQLSYSYFIYFKHAEVPYPSIGDLGFFGSIPLYIYGVILLAKISIVKISLAGFEKKLQAILIPVGLLAISYFLFIRGKEITLSSPLTTFLDFGYPFGEAIYISLALLTYLLGQKILGGVMRSKVLFILFALSVQYLADFIFLYKASRGTWYAGGPNDYIYLVAYFIMTLALLELNTIYKKIKSE